MPRQPVHFEREPGLWPLTWPMGLTMLRLALLPVFLYLLLADADTIEHANRHWALAIFAIMAATDKLDGYLARKLNQTSKLGALLDPIADKILIAISVIALSFPLVAPEGFRIPAIVVIIVYGKDLLVAFGALALLSLVGKVTITPRPLGKATTFLQLVLVIATLMGPDVALLHAGFAFGLVQVLWWTVSLVTLASAVDYVVLGIRQLQASRRANATRTQEMEPQIHTDPHR